MDPAQRGSLGVQHESLHARTSLLQSGWPDEGCSPVRPDDEADACRAGEREAVALWSQRGPPPFLYKGPLLLLSDDLAEQREAGELLLLGVRSVRRPCARLADTLQNGFLCSLYFCDIGLRGGRPRTRSPPLANEPGIGIERRGYADHGAVGHFLPPVVLEKPLSREAMPPFEAAESLGSPIPLLRFTLHLIRIFDQLGIQEAAPAMPQKVERLGRHLHERRRPQFRQDHGQDRPRGRMALEQCLGLQRPSLPNCRHRLVHVSEKRKAGQPTGRALVEEASSGTPTVRARQLGAAAKAKQAKGQPQDPSSDRVLVEQGGLGLVVVGKVQGEIQAQTLKGCQVRKTSDVFPSHVHVAPVGPAAIDGDGRFQRPELLQHLAAANALGLQNEKQRSCERPVVGIARKGRHAV